MQKSELEERYASMSSDELALINRATLTDDARDCYERELERRKSPEWQAREAASEWEYRVRAQANLSFKRDVRKTAKMCWFPIALALGALYIFAVPDRAAFGIIDSLMAGGAISGISWGLGLLIGFVSHKHKRQ